MAKSVYGCPKCGKNLGRYGIKRMYDSTAETLLHIKRVNELLLLFAEQLMHQAIKHDATKLEEPEKQGFDKYTPRLKNTTYGSPEYQKCLDGLSEVLKHHYEHNFHHPQSYANGIEGFDLLDLMEMLVDWKAASERHTDGDIFKSIEINQKRFGLSDQLTKILQNTARRYLDDI